MTKEKVLAQIAETGTRCEPDFVVPINGQQVKLPYYVVRTKETMSGSDNGRVRTIRIEWTVALFTTNRNDKLESQFVRALFNVGKLEVVPYPDGTPYQTTFKFTTNQIMR